MAKKQQEAPKAPAINENKGATPNWQQMAKKKLVLKRRPAKNDKAVRAKTMLVDVIADHLDADIKNWPELKVAINKPSDIEAIQFTGDNIEEIKAWSDKHGGQLKQLPDGTYTFWIWGTNGQAAKIVKGQWLVDYHDKSFGLIDEEVFQKTYVNDKNGKFHKHQTATALLLEADQFKDGVSEETAKKLDQWIGTITEAEVKEYAKHGITVKAGDRKWRLETVSWKEKDANGNEIEKSGPGISVLSKEQWQGIPFGQGQHIIKDTSGGVYPQTKDSLKKRYDVYNYEDIILFEKDLINTLSETIKSPKTPKSR